MIAMFLQSDFVENFRMRIDDIRYAVIAGAYSRVKISNFGLQLSGEVKWRYSVQRRLVYSSAQILAPATLCSVVNRKTSL